MEIQRLKTGYQDKTGAQRPERTDSGRTDKTEAKETKPLSIQDRLSLQSDNQEFRLSVCLPSLSAAGIYGRLANASTKAQVETVLAETQRAIANFGVAAIFGDDKQRQKARAAIGSLRKLILRGNRKIRKLDEETLIKIRKKQAEQNRNRKRARSYQIELKRKKAGRHDYDSGLRAEGALIDANSEYQIYIREQNKIYEYIQPGGPGGSPSGEAVMDAGEMAVGASAADAAEHVTE